MIKKTRALLFSFIISFFVMGGWIFFELWQNNKSVEPPNRIAVESSLNNGISWLNSHRSEILNDPNSMLWWMVKESATLTGNPILNGLYDEYKVRYLDSILNNVWSHIFYKDSIAPLNPLLLKNLPDYNLFFLYGASCSSSLGREPVVTEQLSANFCDDHLFSPACATHQLMGFRFLQRRKCGNQTNTSESIASLQNRLTSQLSWDFRLVDVYLQRVLMLVDSGAHERVKPIWISRVLSGQDSDGGWSGFEPLIPLSKELSLGFSARVMSVDRNQSNFHTTAQGVLLMSLLLSEVKQ